MTLSYDALFSSNTLIGFVLPADEPFVQTRFVSFSKSLWALLDRRGEALFLTPPAERPSALSPSLFVYPLLKDGTELPPYSVLLECDA
jgi:hypothetical protein